MHWPRLVILVVLCLVGLARRQVTLGPRTARRPQPGAFGIMLPAQEPSNPPDPLRVDTGGVSPYNTNTLVRRERLPRPGPRPCRVDAEPAHRRLLKP